MTTATLPDYQVIEGVFKAAKEITSKLPDCTESREARRLLDIAVDLAYRSREKARPERLTDA